MNLSSIKPNFSTANTANTLVQRDASGNVTATTFTGKLAPTVITGETAITDPASDDVVLLYDTSAAGVRKITIDNLMRKINNVPYLEYAWSVNPSATGLTLAHNVFTTLTLNTEVSDKESLGSLSGNVVTLPAGTYQFEASCYISNDNVSGAEGLQYFRLTSGASILAIASLAPEYGGQSKNLNLSGQFNLTASSGISLSVRPYNYDSGTLTVKERFYRSYVGLVSDPSTTEISHRVNLKLWKVG